MTAIFIRSKEPCDEARFENGGREVQNLVQLMEFVACATVSAEGESMCVSPRRRERVVMVRRRRKEKVRSWICRKDRDLL